ncbi:MAG: hypothetical protein J6A69_09475 [Clostridia bacterium]|nr:hypothetical protein [Clostridia bacterium]
MQKKGLSENDLVNLTEKILKNRVDIKYYRAVVSLLEKGYLLNDISAALMMALTQDTEKNHMPKKETKPKGNAVQSKPAAKKESDKKNVKQEASAKRNERRKSVPSAPKKNNPPQKSAPAQKRKKFRPLTRKAKNENSNT